MGSSSSPSGPRPAITAERIVDAAVELTAERGLENWTLRELAGALGAYPAVLYHHVGDRDALICAVLDRVVATLPIPDEGLHWQEWFAQLLADVRVVLHRYPGTARWMVRFSPSVTAATTLVDRGIRLLQEAGFGDESSLILHMLTTTACQFVATEDDRNSPAFSQRLDNAAEYARHHDDPDHPGLATHAKMMKARQADPELAADYHAQMYEYAIRRCLDGLAVRLAELNG